MSSLLEPEWTPDKWDCPEIDPKPESYTIVWHNPSHVPRTTELMFESVSQQLRIVLFQSVFVVLFAIGLTLCVFGPSLLTIDTTTSRAISPGHPTNNDFADNAIRIVTTPNELKAATSVGRCILFVNCDWNSDMVQFRKPFSDFAAWSSKSTDYKTITVKLDGNSQDEMWDTIQLLWKNNSILPGSMKTHGGAGRVVWFKDGNVVDHAWCIEVMELYELKSRSKEALQ